MPYCHKCGAKLDEDAKFCHVCGTPVGVTPATRFERRPRTRVFIPSMFLIALLVMAMVVVGFLFLPVRAVKFTQSEEVAFHPGIEMLNLNFSADIAQVNVVFEDLADRLVTLNVSATGDVGILAPSDPLNVTFDHAFKGNKLMVISRVNGVAGWPWLFGLHVVCDLRVDLSMRVTMNVKTSVGKIVMSTKTGVVFDSLKLEAITGGVEASLVSNVAVNGDVSVRTTTGGIDFSWEDVNVTGDALVEVGTTTGGVNVNVTQNRGLPANVTLNAEATTGGVRLDMTIHDNVGANIESSTAVGGIDVHKTGFSGTKSPLQSDNYPASSNFIVSLHTTTGGVNVNATYTP